MSKIIDFLLNIIFDLIPFRKVDIRYYIARDIKQLCKLDRIPFFTKTMFHANEVSKFHSYLFTKYKEEGIRRVCGPSYPNDTAFLEVYPNARRIPSDSTLDGVEIPMYERDIDKDDLSVIFKEQPLLSDIYNQIKDFNRYIKCIVSCCLCSSDDYETTYYTPEIRPVYIEIKNTSQNGILIKNITFQKSKNGKIVWSFDDFSYEVFTETLPEVELLPGHSILVPIATIIEPPETPNLETYSEGRTAVPEEEPYHMYLLNPSGFKRKDNMILLGPCLVPRAFELRNILFMESHIRIFDKSNTFILNEEWECGSCPHVFFLDKNGLIKKYYGEIFNKADRLDVKQEIDIEPWCQTVVIAELENEITTISKIEDGCECINNKNIILNKNEHIRIYVSGKNKIIIHGKYEAYGYSNIDKKQENTIVAINKFITEWNNNMMKEVVGG